MRSVFFVDRGGIAYYGGNVHAVIYFPFPQGSVIDLEIINEDEVRIKFIEWVKVNKIEPVASVLFFASNTTFQKEIATKETGEKREELKKTFVELVPFNETFTAEYVLQNTILIVVANKHFAFMLRDMIQTAGFTIEFITPAAAVYGSQQMNGIDASIAQHILKQSSLVRAGAFSAEESELVEEFPSENISAPAKKNTRLYVLIGVFGLLAVILVVVYVVFMPTSAPSPRTVEARRPPLLSPTLPVESQGSSSATLVSSTPQQASTLLKSEIKIRVLNGSGIPGQADTIKGRLQEKSFTGIETGNAPSVQSANTLLIFKSGVGEKERKEILNILEFYFTSVSVQQKEDIDTDVLITTSQSIITPSP